MRDYKLVLDPPRRRPLHKRHWPWLAMIAVGGLTLALVSLSPDEAGASREASSATTLIGEASPIFDRAISLDLNLPGKVFRSPAPQAQAAAAPGEATGIRRETVTIRSGDTLASLFKRLGVSAQELHGVLQGGEAVSALRKIYPGEELDFEIDESSRLRALAYRIDPTRTLRVRKLGDRFEASMDAREYERRQTRASAVIEQSLFDAATGAGLSESLTMELAGIFGWDVDFALDIRGGDRFSVIYEELYLDGERIGQGNIVAAEFINQGRAYRAVRFQRPDGVSDYYTPEGLSLRKAFLRTPVDFRRISSRFTRSRCHPVLGICRPHQGVDYAASTGTPIRAAGDGIVVSAGDKGGYGRTVVLRHGQTYTTLYAHMSRIAPGIRAGRRVSQGQTIGYVGSSGLATGPHLHYEFRVNGVYRNPLTIRLPQAEPLASELRADFQTLAAPLLAQLDLITRTDLALAEAER